MENRGPWKVENSTCKFKNNFLEVVEDHVIQPDGQPGNYATVTIKPGISVLPLDSDGNVYLTRQFRYALGQESIEAVAGGINEGEEPLDAAKREAREEMGIEAKDWIELGRIEEDTSLVRSPGYLFLAQDLSFTQPQRDTTEKIQILRMSFEEAVRKVMNNEVVHSPTALLILKVLLVVGS